MPSTHAPLFQGLPAPAAGSLTVYVFGPGFGESQVVALPDGRWMVVDACRHHGVNLPLELLRHFGAAEVALLVLTHPDTDHFQGLPELMAGVAVRKLWCFPGFGTTREIIIEHEKTRHDPDFGGLLAAHEAMAPLKRAVGTRGREVGYDTIAWMPDAAGYAVWCVAPGGADLQREGGWIRKLFDRVKGGHALTVEEKRRLMGEANAISLALVVVWGDVRILLGGDVEHDERDPACGWPGVVANLREDGRLHLLENLRLVKAAHHGSNGAFCEETWRCHAKDGPVDLVIVTRFNRGANPPPHRDGLAPILAHAHRLALTSEPADGWARVTDGGWVRILPAPGRRPASPSRCPRRRRRTSPSRPRQPSSIGGRFRLPCPLPDLGT